MGKTTCKHPVTEMTFHNMRFIATVAARS